MLDLLNGPVSCHGVMKCKAEVGMVWVLANTESAQKMDRTYCVNRKPNHAATHAIKTSVTLGMRPGRK